MNIDPALPPHEQQIHQRATISLLLSDAVVDDLVEGIVSLNGGTGGARAALHKRLTNAAALPDLADSTRQRIAIARKRQAQMQTDLQSAEEKLIASINRANSWLQIA